MNPIAWPATAAIPAIDSPNGAARGLGALLIVTALLSFAPVAILAPAIGWR